ncbi:D-aminoacyl-tRNA deacylase [Desulfofustis limnaeus]|jgi:D-tyrosyl-tRNA(Tyr) deacylase|uniref:D-aminoacyl-tRNA deacylase n=1 Tax=Desulfofustis limnaeus TaxID=2740163 RepID=A0ABM7WEJ5_9BACT|nr:D-aminoacyl-tRNA deacylase [Desulfofustis limnaeus]MDX9894119.1 D-aminoacyl-tRNA deacylase [Desulfofustis sp.]BDD89424.1 D-aminoacyl-tRNA deacylase [Desulfofustis limnaeus]
MRAVVQRTTKAAVTVAGQEISSIGPGVVVFLGIHQHDGSKEVAKLADKLVHLRIFPDQQGRMNRSLADLHGELLVVSQFTLYGDCRKGRRPSFSQAAPPHQAEQLYRQFVETVERLGIKVATGRFQADMDVCLVNDGPVTLLLDTASAF